MGVTAAIGADGLPVHEDAQVSGVRLPNGRAARGADAQTLDQISRWRNPAARVPLRVPQEPSAAAR
jgi:hypothetical protein